MCIRDRAWDVLKAVYPGYKQSKLEKVVKSLKVPVFSKSVKKDKSKAEPLKIKGLIPGMAVHFAGCCHPLPGDRIVGIVTTGKGVAVHRIDCKLLEKFADEPERWLDISWGDAADDTPPVSYTHLNDKNSVIALREIADETVSIEELQKSLVMGLQKYVEVEEPEEEELEIMAAEKELADLDDQFTGLLPQAEIDDNMQVHGGDDLLDVDADSDVEGDDVFGGSLGDDDLSMDDGLEGGDDLGDDFDDEN